MLTRTTTFGFLLAALVSTGTAAKSPYVECAARTGQNASVFIRSDVNPTINGVVLEEGDEIVVLDTNGRCAGKAVWTGDTASITVWGDDEMTEAVDGLQPGERLRFVVYDVSEDAIFGSDESSVEISFDAEFPFEGGDAYRPDALFNVTYFDVSGDPSDPPAAEVVKSYELGAAYPNPFNPVTNFELQITEAQDVAIRVYNSLGQQVALLHDGLLSAGLEHRFQFDGYGLSSGMYLIRVLGDSFAASRPVVMLK